MNKTDLIDYLNKQQEIESKNIAFKAYKQSIITVLDHIFGLGNKYNLQLQKIEVVQKESLEELYPKMLTDEAESIAQFNLVLQNIVTQIELLEPEILKKNEETKQLNSKLFKALQSYFSDVEISKLKAIVVDKNTSKNDLIEHLRVIETEKRINVLAAILDDINIF